MDVRATGGRPMRGVSIFLLFTLVGAALYFPFLYNRFHYDDFFWISILEEKIPYNPLVGFWSVDAAQFKGFTSNWWVEAKDPGEFFRPIFSGIFALAYKLFGRGAALPLHALSLLLHCANAFLTYAVLRRLSRRYFLSLAAGFLFLISADHAMTIGWISTGTDIIAVFFILLSLLAWLKGEDGMGWHWAVAFLSAWKSWAPAYVLLIGYLLFYKLSGFGTHNLAYYDPLQEPSRYLKSLVVNLPLMYAGLVSNVPIGLTLFLPQAVPPAALFGGVLFILFSAVLIPYRQDRLIQFSYLFFAVALLPQLSTEATERQLYFPMVTGVYLISFVIFQLPGLRDRFCPDTAPRLPYLGRAWSVYLLVSSLFLALVLAPTYAVTFRPSLEAPQNAVLKARALMTDSEPEAVVHLNGPGAFFAFYAPDIYRFHAGHYLNVRVLSSFNGLVYYRENNANSFSLKTDKAGWLSGMFSKIVRLRPTFSRGQVYANETFTVTIEEITADAEDILQARFEFKRPLTDPRLIFIQYDSGTMRRWNAAEHSRGSWRLVGDTTDVFKEME
ncbi:MAG: hypothetical protein HY042_01805 [Spirochaetia bacterium]|nr:hypothetical protein [Spirochaetia bacterium]